MSRERNGKVVIGGNGGSRNYPVGTQNMQRHDPLKLVNVYANAQQKRQAARQMLNKKSSEEKLPSGGAMLYNQRKPIEQRYKSQIRGQEV